MGKSTLIFVFTFFIAFGGGYFIYHPNAKTSQAAVEKQSSTKQQQSKEGETAKSGEKASAPAATTSSKEGEIFTKRGCVQCHSVSALGIKAGQVGPDLSKAYTTVEGKHGKKIEDFLKAPTSAVMSGVLGKQPLTDDERNAVLEALKVASEK
ncbi:MAG TPA: c-type cytochrome [Bacillota bacterium]|nr:c-type cytochrome [Bacillota bacterium]